MPCNAMPCLSQGTNREQQRNCSQPIDPIRHYSNGGGHWCRNAEATARKEQEEAIREMNELLADNRNHGPVEGKRNRKRVFRGEADDDLVLSGASEKDISSDEASISEYNPGRPSPSDPST